MNAESRDLEILVAKIQAQLSPTAEVLHDVRLPGRKSGRSRQIDVLVRQQIGQYTMLIVLDCKDYTRPVDVKGVEEFAGLIDDVGAHKGALVCPKGFTRAAKERAASFQIDLYSPVDTDPHKWQARVGVPAAMDFRVAQISFGIRGSRPVPFKLRQDFFSTSECFSQSGEVLGTPLDSAVARWNDGEYPAEPGIHQDLPVFAAGADVCTDNGYGIRIPITLTCALYVEKQLYFGYLPIAKVSGLRDERTGGLLTNAFTTGIVSPDEIINTWTRIETIDDAPRAPGLVFTGLIGWGA